jgi:hypothetical protein
MAVDEGLANKVLRSVLQSASTIVGQRRCHPVARCPARRLRVLVRVFASAGGFI